MKILPSHSSAPVRAVAVAGATRPGGAGVVHAERASFDPSVLFSCIAFTFYVGVSLYGVAGRLLSITFPLGCLLVAGLCFFRSPRTYLGFTLWLYLLTPFARRVYDLHYGFHATSTLLLGPIAASAWSLITVVRRRRLLRNTTYIPFVIALSALTYAFLIGIIRQALVPALYDLLAWLTPIGFGMHLALEWPRFPQSRAVLTRAVLVGLMVTSIYGIWQFVDPAMWDRVWVVNAEMFSVGAPLPFVIRVFSTLNAPGPYSIMLVFSLFIGLAAPQRWKAIPLALGLVCLILTKTRSAWGAFVLGAVVMQLRQPLRALPRQWVVILGVFLLATPLILQPRFLTTFTRRAATLRNVEADRSFLSRTAFTSVVLDNLSRNPTGSGLGGFGGAAKLLTGSKSASALDSGPLEIYAIMGWIGGTLFMLSLLAIILQIIRTRRIRYEPVTAAAVSCVVAFLFASLFGDIFNSASGFFFWSALGLATAGRTYGTSADLAARYGNHPAALSRIAGNGKTAA
jgi:hypothetical protein